MSWRILAPLATLAGCLLWLGLSQAAAQTGGDIDWNRARELHRKDLDGQPLSPDERAYLERARQARHRQAGQPPAKPPVGLKPLTDMTGKDRYKGEDGGLYGGGTNRPPEKHLEAAMRAARLIRPARRPGHARPGRQDRAALGGHVEHDARVLEFMRLAAGDAGKSAKVVLVDGAQGGMTATAWANPTGPPAPTPEALGRSSTSGCGRRA